MIDVQVFLRSEAENAVASQVLPYEADDIQKDAGMFIAENRWWGIVPEIEGKKLLITEDEQAVIHEKLNRFFEMMLLSPAEKYDYLLQVMQTDRPILSDAFRDFVYATEMPYEVVYPALDFLVVQDYTGDLSEITDNTLTELMTRAFHDLQKVTGDLIGFFFSWLRQEKKISHILDDGTVARTKIRYDTHYSKDYVMTQRVDRTIQKSAYNQDDYLEFMYYLFNEEYIQKNDMYKQAAESKDYADTWLYLSLHFVCALRKTDLLRIPHPELTREPQKLLELAANGSMDAAEAKGYSIRMMEWMYYMSLKPNKTLRYSGVPDIRFFIPASLEYHFGMLFAICEAHHVLSYKGNHEPLVRCISDYAHIQRYMGNQIGGLFREADFLSRRANKAYMQAFQLYSTEVLGADTSIENTMGYILASMARSHKGTCAGFASTTVEYLKDASFSGLSAEFVARELFERGVLSTIPSMLLKIITGNEYNKMAPGIQTELVKTLDMSPLETERLIDHAVNTRKEAVDFMTKMLPEVDPEVRQKLIISILHRIGTGQAPALDEQTSCLMMAMGRECVTSEPRENACLSCPYQILTKAAMFHLVCEYNRIIKMAKSTSIPEEKYRYKWILQERLIPLISETFTVLEDMYGKASTEELYKIINDTKEI